MNGKIMYQQTRQLLQEGETSNFIDERTTFDYLFEAACQFAMDTKILTASMEITTVADQAEYDLNANFIGLQVKNDTNEPLVRYYDGTNYYFLTWRDQDPIWEAHATAGVAIPSNFTITDGDVKVPLTGTATSAGAASNGVCTLTDATKTFISSGVNPGDQISNETDVSDGVVLSVTSETKLVVALFGGTGNDWTNADAYTLTRQVCKKLVLDPYPSADGDKVVIKYIRKPAPVYSDYGTYPIPDTYLPSIIKYAAFLYKYRDREPNFGDYLYKHWDMMVRKANNLENRMPNRGKWKVNMKKRSLVDRSWR